MPVLPGPYFNGISGNCSASHSIFTRLIISPRGIDGITRRPKLMRHWSDKTLFNPGIREPVPTSACTIVSGRPASARPAEYMNFRGAIEHVCRREPSPNKDINSVAAEICVVTRPCDLYLSGLSNHCRNQLGAGDSVYDIRRDSGYGHRQSISIANADVDDDVVRPGGVFQCGGEW